MKKAVVLAFLLLLLAAGGGTASADWAFDFVVFNGSMYQTTGEFVDSAMIGPVIGKVTSYSDQEGVYRGNFSNAFPAGTEYYQIAGTAAKAALAVKTGEDRFVKAVFTGPYGGSRASSPQTGPMIGAAMKRPSGLNDYRLWFGLAGGVLVLLILIGFFRKK
ncbi:hypothetical protein [Paenibacillus humicola]|uniref:hypothetical protein n=1 Tax=Paenibacillus humicola TaxID=3110540 RepID=UPI00237BE9EF|nr:hypothetical protein [Paenibacillus humicola]